MLLCLSSGTDLKKSRHVLKSLSLCNKVLSYLILSLSLSLILVVPLNLFCVWILFGMSQTVVNENRGGGGEGGKVRARGLCDRN